MSSSWYAKVAWQEGLFFRPQLFQQQERYFEQYAHHRAMPLSPFYWGFRHYRLDDAAKTLGKVVVSAVSGVFADGTPFDAPGGTPLPPPLTVRPEHLGQVIYLAVPIRMPNREETTFEASADSLARYQVFDTELRDSNSINLGAAMVQLSALRLRLVPEKELADGWIGLALTRVHTQHADGSIELDDLRVPPVSGYGASALMSSWITDLHELARLRADSLAQRLAGSDGDATAGAATVTDYLLLQILNRYEPLLRHVGATPTTSPEQLYALLLGMDGELSTHLDPGKRRPKLHEAYDHAQPYKCIRPLFDSLRALLNMVLVRGALYIALNDLGHNMRNAALEPGEMRSFSAMVLAVHADIPAEQLRQQFAAQAKVGPPDKVEDLVHSHLPGVVLQAMPVPPRQIPFNAGYVYFELARTGALWEEMAQHGGLALHVSGDLPSLKLELWGIRA